MKTEVSICSWQSMERKYEFWMNSQDEPLLIGTYFLCLWILELDIKKLETMNAVLVRVELSIVK